MKAAAVKAGVFATRAAISAIAHHQFAATPTGPPRMAVAALF